MANLFAQTKALAFGLTKEEVKKKILHENKNEVDLIPHRTSQVTDRQIQY